MNSLDEGSHLFCTYTHTHKAHCTGVVRIPAGKRPPVDSVPEEVMQCPLPLTTVAILIQTFDCVK